MPIAARRLTTTELADLALAHLAEDPEQLMGFMTVTGYDPAGLRKAVGSDALARGLIEYVAGNEPLLLALCAANGLRPEDVMRVYYKLNPAG